MCKNRLLLHLAVGLSEPLHLEAKKKDNQLSLTGLRTSAHALTLDKYTPPALHFPYATRTSYFDVHQGTKSSVRIRIHTHLSAGPAQRQNLNYIPIVKLDHKPRSSPPPQQKNDMVLKKHAITFMPTAARICYCQLNVIPAAQLKHQNCASSVQAPPHDPNTPSCPPSCPSTMRRSRILGKVIGAAP